MNPNKRGCGLGPHRGGRVGLVRVMTQLALMRELLGSFSGNELVLGISMGSWLMLTGLGTWLGQFLPGGRERPASGSGLPSGELREAVDRGLAGAAPSSRSAVILTTGLILIALIPLAQVVAVRVLRDVVFLRGAAVGVSGTVARLRGPASSFCLVSGALLAQACALLARANAPTAISRVYLADSLGSIGGGVLFSFVLIPYFDHFALLCFPRRLESPARRRAGLAFSPAPAAGIGDHHRRRIDRSPRPDQRRRGHHLRPALGRRVVFRASSPYGRLVVTDDAGQLTFFENASRDLDQNVDQVEETVHYAMSQRPDARQVLLIGGGIAGTAREILRYGVAEVTYVELDPLILAAGAGSCRTTWPIRVSKLSLPMPALPPADRGALRCGDRRHSGSDHVAAQPLFTRRSSIPRSGAS